MTIDQMTVGELLGSMAAKTPAPGGGAAAALTAALAAALGQMVVHYSIGKPSCAPHRDLHEEALRTLGQFRMAALDLADADAEAFNRLSQLRKLNPNDQRRQAEWADAVAAVIETPQRIIETSLGTLHLLSRLLEATAASLRSDLAVAALLAQAAARSAAWNVRINLSLLEDPAQARQLEADTDDMLDRAGKICDTIETKCHV